MMILTIIFTILSAAYDTKNRFTNHIPRFVFRAISVFLISYYTSTSFWLNTAIFYSLFDYTLNLFEGRNIFWFPQLLFKITLIILLS